MVRASEVTSYPYSHICSYAYRWFAPLKLRAISIAIPIAIRIAIPIGGSGLRSYQLSLQQSLLVVRTSAVASHPYRYPYSYPYRWFAPLKLPAIPIAIPTVVRASEVTSYPYSYPYCYPW